MPPRRLTQARRTRLPSAAVRAVFDVVAILREAVLIPLRLWMAAAEVAGQAVLAVWDVVAPVLRAALRLAARALRRAERAVTPAEGVAVVVAGAVALLVASQWSDYRAVEVGDLVYREVADITPPARVAEQRPIDHHGVLVLLLAAGSLAAMAMALGGRWQVARALLLIGAAVVAISLLVDLPPGLDDARGGAGYLGPHAILLGGFWAQLWSGIVIAFCGPLLAIHLRHEDLVFRRPHSAAAPSANGIQGART